MDLNALFAAIAYLSSVTFAAFLVIKAGLAKENPGLAIVLTILAPFFLVALTIIFIDENLKP